MGFDGSTPVIQGGFLANALHEREPQLAKKIETKTGQLLDCRTQGACQESKRCLGGRAYSDHHELVFDIAASASEFPELFGKVKFDQPYHLLNSRLAERQHASIYRHEIGRSEAGGVRRWNR